MEPEKGKLYYSVKTMDEVKKKNDIVDVVNEFTPLSGSGGMYRGNCIFHEDKEKSLLVSKKDQAFQCVGCGESGDVYSFIMKAKDASLTEAVEYLADRAHVKLPPAKESKSSEKARDSILAINKEAAQFYHETLLKKEGEQGLKYFKEDRQLSKRTITRFGLGYAPDRATALYDRLKNKGFSDEQIKKSGLVTFYKGNTYDKFRGRVMNPVFDASGNVAGFSGRTLGDNTPKYINSPETLAFDKKNNLYGLNFAKDSGKDGLILCEGNLDVVSLHQNGFTNAVAPLGTAFTKEQAALLSQYTDKVHLAFDNDNAGMRATQRAIPMLKEQGISVDVIDMGQHKDPDEFLKAEGADMFQKQVEHAESSYRFEARAWTNGYDFLDKKGSEDGMKAFAGHLLDLPQDEWENYTEAMQELVSGYQSGEIACTPLTDDAPAARDDTAPPVFAEVEPETENQAEEEKGYSMDTAKFLSEYEIEYV